jgi:hypothetical protein
VHTRLGPATCHVADMVQLVDIALLPPSVPAADVTSSQVPQEAALLRQEARELMHGRLVGDRCGASLEGEISISSVEHAAAEKDCSPQVSREVGEATTGRLGLEAEL